MRKTFQFRLYPNHSQSTTLIKTLELCRWVYNETLATRKNAWEQESKTISLFETHKLLTVWKTKKPELRKVYAQVLQNVQARVDFAYQTFFKRVKAGEKPGYPRFKGVGRFDSFTFPQGGFSIKQNRLLLSKIGLIKIILHRPIEGQIKTLTIKRDSAGNWYANFSCIIAENHLPPSNQSTGVDVGLTHFITLSNGEKVDNPRFFRNEEKALAQAQRKFSKADKGTCKQKKQLKVVARIYERITNRRKNFAHQLSRRLVNAYGFIAFEKLNEQNMLQNHSVAKSISDAAWSQVIQFSAYKAAEAGRVVVLVDPKGTSLRCSQCGYEVQKTLSMRVHRCPECGLTIDRDVNAAINILALGLQSLGTSPKSPSSGLQIAQSTAGK